MGCSDRGHSAASQIKPGEVNWEKLFGEEGVRWFHTGGIFAALAPNTSEAVIEAVEIARKYGTIVSYDLNYRASLWKSQGGKEGAQKINRNIAKHVDVMIGNEEDFTACLGFEVEGLDDHISAINPANFKKMIQTAVKQFPNFKVAATTLRNAKTATFNDWSAILWHDGKFHESRPYPRLEILDRVGFPADRTGSPMEDLSRGMQQKVALARALLTSPTLLLLDEPTTGLDPRSKLEVQGFITGMRSTHDTTTLLCTHDMAEAEALADRVGILDRGRLLALEAPDALRRRYGAESLEEAFLAATGRPLEDE